MAYLVNQTNGTLLATVLDGAVDRSHAGIALIGKQVTNYGEIQNENFVRITENFNSAAAPVNPLVGQQWWNNQTSTMYEFDGTSWRTASGFTSSASVPLTPKSGDRWWDTVKQQYYLYSGTAWRLIGPAFSASAGKTGPIVDTLTTSTGTPVTVTTFYANDVAISILNSGAAFTPATAIPGFTSISTGYSFSTLITAAKFNGTATNADNATHATNADTATLATNAAHADHATDADTATNASNADSLGGIPASQYVTQNTPFTGAATFSTDGISVGGMRILEVNDVPEIISSKSNTITFKSLNAGSVVSTMQIVGLDIVPAINDVSSLGTIAKTFNTVYATTVVGQSSSAKYADLAEKYLADADYEAGTVLAVGGINEVTYARTGDRAIGVVSTDPAFKMNSDLVGGTYVALKGRVPVNIDGTVKKGDKLVAADYGRAKACAKMSFEVFAIALHDSSTGEVECVLL